MLNAREIQNSLLTCDICGTSGSLPFSFPLEDQKVMLISAAPSLQAAHKPLTSIRFFRRLCLALFGDKYLREKDQCEKYLLEFGKGGGIYWTHYRKCYTPGLDDFHEIDDTCAKRYLRDEIRALRCLELIVVLGEEIVDKVRDLIPAGRAQVCYMPFPGPDNVDDFSDIRKKIAPYLRFVKRVGFANESIRQQYVDMSGDVRGHPAHLQFELEALERMLGWRSTSDTTRVEDWWYKSIVVPNMQRCAQLVAVHSFVESQIKTVLHEEHPRTRVVTCWLRVFCDYVRGLNEPHLLQEGRSLTERIRPIILLRNAIVHGSGFVSKEVLQHAKRDGGARHGDSLPTGLHLLAGMVFISKEGEETLKLLARDATDLLCKLDQYAHTQE